MEIKKPGVWNNAETIGRTAVESVVSRSREFADGTRKTGVAIVERVASKGWEITGNTLMSLGGAIIRGSSKPASVAVRFASLAITPPPGHEMDGENHAFPTNSDEPKALDTSVG